MIKPAPIDVIRVGRINFWILPGLFWIKLIGAKAGRSDFVEIRLDTNNIGITDKRLIIATVHNDMAYDFVFRALIASRSAIQVGRYPPIHCPIEMVVICKPDEMLNRYVRSVSLLFSIRKGPIATPDNDCASPWTMFIAKNIRLDGNRSINPTEAE